MYLIVNFLKLKKVYKIPGISYYVIVIIHTLNLILYVKLIYTGHIRVYDITLLWITWRIKCIRIFLKHISNQHVITYLLSWTIS